MFRFDVLVQQLYVKYKSKLIQITRGLHLPGQLNESVSENNDNHLIFKKGTKENIKLGDRVKIHLKKRQLKQIQEDEWDELMTKDIGKIGTVVHILVDGANEAIVFFPHSGRRWLLHPSALRNVSDEFASDGSDEATSLKVGDYVNLVYGPAVVEQIQDSKSTHWQLIMLFQDYLGKILSLDENGYAYVSVGDRMSLHINPVILKRRQSASSRKADLEQPLKFASTEMQKKYPIHCDVHIKTEIKEFVKQPFWEYQLTQILGARGKVSHHGMFGEVGITIKEQTWILPYMMFEKKKTRQNPQAPYTNKEYPFAVGDLVLLCMAYAPSFERTLDELCLPRSFEKVCQGLAKFLGYSSPTKCVIEMDGSRLQVKVHHLRASSDLKISKDDKFKAVESRHEKLKVGDDAQLNFGPTTLAKQVLDELKIPFILQKILLSPAKLVAFDDDKDLALLRYTEKISIWIDSGFITCADDTTDVENLLKSLNLASLPDSLYDTALDRRTSSLVANITEAMDFVEQVKNILQSLKIKFSKPDLYSGHILIANIAIQVTTGANTVREICSKIESTVGSTVKQEESQLSFSNPQHSAIIRLILAEAESMDHGLIESIEANNDIASVQQEDLPVTPFISEPCYETIQPSEILGVPDSDQQENNDQLSPASADDQLQHQQKETCMKIDPNKPGTNKIGQNFSKQLFGKDLRQGPITFNVYGNNFESCHFGGSS